MADYHVCRWFIPFVSFNAFSIIDAGNNIGLTSEGYDVINFGSTGAQGDPCTPPTAQCYR